MLVKVAFWTHNKSINKLGYSPLHLANGMVLLIPCLTMGNVPTENMTDAEAVKKKMTQYTRRCGAPTNWTEAEKREKTEGQVILNEQRRIEVETAAGRLITPDAHEERITQIALLCAGQIDRLPELLGELAPASERPKWRKMGKELSGRINNAIAEALR